MSKYHNLWHRQDAGHNMRLRVKRHVKLSVFVVEISKSSVGAVTTTMDDKEALELAEFLINQIRRSKS